LCPLARVWAKHHDFDCDFDFKKAIADIAASTLWGINALAANKSGSNCLRLAYVQTQLRLAATLYKRKGPCGLNENV
ncbi:hypothetical protein L2755_21060, partial [Shewanella abyssi]|uniref:hypothetical protein n=1 Tax=Shewanella abyssi TaxID=311789 RepID=UPI00200FFFA3